MDDPRVENKVAKPVIDAMFELVQETSRAQSVESISERAGVSVASIFRYFAGLDDLQRETFARFTERFEHQILLPQANPGSVDLRVREFVAHRASFYAEANPLLRVAQSRALENPTLAEQQAKFRSVLFAELERYFAEDRCSRAQLSIIDTTTSPEAWHLLQYVHGLTADEISEAWIDGVSSLLRPIGVDRTSSERQI